MVTASGPSTFKVLAVDVPKGRDVDCGSFDTLEEARGCVEFDRIEYYEIWQGDHIVVCNYPAGW